MCSSDLPCADSLSGIRTWEATEARIASGWKNKATAIDDAAWTLAEDNVWEKK